MNKMIKLLLLVFISSIFSYAQIGINIDNPQTTLDINGDLRIRKIETNSVDANSKKLVVDENGLFKEIITGRDAILEAQLQSNFSSSSVFAEKSKITNWLVLKNPYNDFSSSTSIFTVPVKGIYSIIINYSLRLLSDETDNYVLGLVNQSDDKWLLRFSQERSFLTSNEATVSAKSFAGVVELEKGQKCFFAITQNIGIIAKQNNVNVSSISIHLIETK